ncbi:YhgE/Pip domain-containing protein [Paenibacillus sp. Leaf72]|uniref:YhgE/Pip domain-containing protein n=1 Tax=Paenibacillus sp. Leaf72 TaxID=1736234 RepID=UPI0006F2963C|nr:YhgE/Pip domain-containing protein [Paenibacillus sp. Leaf72]KQN98987.1 hypothetical protein ASF12_19585 [Paenibacillus sp. Leaf72]
MGVFQVFWKEIKLLGEKPMVLLTLAGVALLPMLYSSFLVEGSWDPYGQTSKLPVAVVNLDQGADYEGKQLHIGEDFVDELGGNTDFSWSFVTQDQAKTGMSNNHYYMTITIPEQFSQDAATLTEAEPKQAEIIFEPNSDYNFVGAQIGSTAMKELKSKLTVQITEAYTRSMFEQIDKISDGLGKAGSGATELQDGAGKLGEGITTLKTNLNKLASGTADVQVGVKQLASGAGDLAKGAGTLKSGTATLSSGLSELSAAAAKLGAGASSAGDGAAKLEAGLQAASAGSGKLSAGLTASEKASAQVAAGASQVADGLEQLVASSPELQSNEQLAKLLAASRQVASGSEQLHDGQKQLLTGSTELAKAQKQLLDGAAKLSSGQQELAQGLHTFSTKMKEAAAGGQKTAEGASSLQAGAAKLQTGLGKLNGGVSELADGSKKLDDGAGQLADGSVKLVDGSGELASQLNEAASKSSEVQSGDSTVSMFAAPVKITENTDHKLSHYGLGITPYFLSLALFMGALVFTTVFSLRESGIASATPMQRFVSRTMTFTMVSLVQSVIADTVLLYGLKLEVHSKPLFFLFTIITSLTFTWIVQMLVTWLDNPGRFAVIVLMILQLTSSAGTFPLEMLPDWMQKVNPWLPMTHSIIGFKAIVASGDFGVMREQMMLLGIFAIIALALTFLYFYRQTGKNEKLQAITA